MVGTIFINSIAAMQSTYATNAKIVLKPLHKFVGVPDIISGMNTLRLENGEYHISIGNLFYDQSKDIIFN